MPTVPDATTTEIGENVNHAQYILVNLG